MMVQFFVFSSRCVFFMCVHCSVVDLPPRVYVDHSIYKGKAVLTLSPKPPEFSTLDVCFVLDLLVLLIEVVTGFYLFSISNVCVLVLWNFEYDVWLWNILLCFAVWCS